MVGVGGGARMGRGVIRAEILSFSQARRTPQAERPASLGCYNPVMEDAVSYATLSFPLGETDTRRLRYQGGDTCTLGGTWG